MLDSDLGSMRSFASGAGSAVSSGGASDGGSGFDWLGAAEAIAGAVLGGAGSDDHSDGDSMLKSFDGTDDSDGGSLLSDAQPFEFQPDTLSDDVTELAARGVSEANEVECFAQYERDMDECTAYRKAMGGVRFMDTCSQHAFQNYQQCRGY
ncbi:hypothetical protein BYI23_A000100 [Burkholderia sp. YI23]|nr:hypothetical protein BYI23_A000100 [Burkholderia sp. YI23]